MYFTLLDDRLLMTPPLALGRCHELVGVMAERAWKALSLSLSQLDHYDAQEARQIRENEDETDRYEDEIGTYLIKFRYFISTFAYAFAVSLSSPTYQ